MRFGQAIARTLAVGDAILLVGELGAGKTTLARAILVALGVEEDTPSPTYTLVQTYETTIGAVLHADLWRLDDHSDVTIEALNDALGSAALLIEWPNKVGISSTREGLALTLRIADEGRMVTWEGFGRWATWSP